ncbi:hypothetical protein [Endozoicomonas sp. YOMI1]|uniref:hypothetical protein n=1 Tax=Endozoicomonas sp. YOMI1 TaxID=2828739 RepID=UPI0021473417|nr:hypothetical protein [Endozoicomonas sp. YOMI1]
MFYPPSAIVTRQQQAYSLGAAHAEPQNQHEIEFDRQLGPREASMAEELYDQLKGRHRNRSDHSWHCEVKRSYFDRLVGFQRGSEEPVIIQVHDKTKKYIGRGSYGFVYESSHLIRKAERCWGVPQGEQYKRVMKIQDNTEDARSEIDFHSEQPGSLGAGKFEGFQYLDQLRIPGKCLGDYFKDETWPLKDRFECAVAMLMCAKTYAAGGKAHPDIKPANMIYDDVKKEVSFIDNAHVQDLEDPSAVKPREPRGTPLFIEPEQYRKIETTAKSMVYSLGIVMLNLFSDKPDEYEVARSGIVEGRSIQLKPERILPKFRETSPEFVRQLEGFLIEMVSESSDIRPDLGECLTQLTAFSSGYKLIEETESKIRSAYAKLAHLQKELKQSQKSKALTKSDAITQQQIAQLKEEGAGKERVLQQMLAQQQVAINEMKEQQKQKLEEVMQAGQLELERMQRVAEASETQKALYKKMAEESESGVKKAHRQLQQLTGVVNKLKSTLSIKDKQLEELAGVAVKAEKQNQDVNLARAKAEEKSTEYELALEIEKNGRKEAMDQLDEAKFQKGKLEAEKASEARKVRRLASKLSENLQAPLDNLKMLARNGANIDIDEFGKMLPGVLEALPSNSLKIRYLEKLAILIFCNVAIDGGADKPYTHRCYFRAFSLYPRRQVDFTGTQRTHLEAVTQQAKVLANKMLKGSDESKREACHFLNEGFAAQVQATDVLTKDNGWAESLLASTPGIAKYQFTPAQVENFGFRISSIGMHFKDGREGDPGKSKQLTEYMLGLEQLDEVSAAKSLLDKLALKETVDQLEALENEFLSILTRPNAYTRGDQDTVAWLAESMLTRVTGERHIRQDVDSPSATKMRHIALLRSAYDEALKPLMEKKLTSLEVKYLANSRLVKFSPAQYQHELQGFQNDLKCKVATLLESEKNFATYKDYLYKKFAADFSAS